MTTNGSYVPAEPSCGCLKVIFQITLKRVVKGFLLRLCESGHLKVILELMLKQLFKGHF